MFGKKTASKKRSSEAARKKPRKQLKSSPRALMVTPWGLGIDEYSTSKKGLKP